MRTGSEKIATLTIQKELRFEELHPNEQGLIKLGEFVRDSAMDAPEGSRCEFDPQELLKKLAEFQNPTQPEEKDDEDD